MKIEFDTIKFFNKLTKDHSEYFYTFIDRPNLAGGVLLVHPGEEDTQAPHDSDELYYIISGNGYLEINKKKFPISEGKVFFVPRNTSHHFFGNTQKLKVLYFFGAPDS